MKTSQWTLDTTNSTRKKLITINFVKQNSDNNLDFSCFLKVAILRIGVWANLKKNLTLILSEISVPKKKLKKDFF